MTQSRSTMRVALATAAALLTVIPLAAVPEPVARASAVDPPAESTDPRLAEAIERDLGISVESYLEQVDSAAAASEVVERAAERGVVVEARLDGDSAVVATVAAADTDVVSQVARDVQQRVGVDDIEVVVDAPSDDIAIDTTFYAATDVWAGDGVTFGGGSQRCSIGAAGTNSAGAAVMLTAGHCTVSQAGDVYRHLAVTAPGFRPTGTQSLLGSAIPGAFRIGNGADGGLIAVTSSRIAPQPILETYSLGRGAARQAPIVIRDVVEPVRGAPVCTSGATTGWTCGRILSVNQRVTVTGSGVAYAVDGVITDACLLPGDSGGPAVIGSALVGIASATGFGRRASDTSTPEQTCATTPTEDRLSVLFAMRSSLGGMSTVASEFGAGWEPTVHVDTPVITSPSSTTAFDASRNLTVSGTLAESTPRTRIEVRWGPSGRASTPVRADGTWSVTVPAAALARGVQSLDVSARWGQRSASDPLVLVGATRAGWHAVATSRVQGESRYDTAVALTQRAFPTPGVGPAFLVVGTNYPDALAASPVAAQLGGVILLTDKNVLPTATRDELVRLRPSEIVIVGGPLAISSGTENAVRALGMPVRRVSGPTRYDTAALLTQLGFPGGTDQAFLATGTNFPDGLAAGAAGGALGAPVLLAPGTDGVLPQATSASLRRLSPDRIFALGATPVMAPAIVGALQSIAPTTRLGGDTRYDTALLIAQTASPLGTRADTVYLATGLNFPDALAAGPVAGTGDDPLLLVQPQCVPASVLRHIVAAKPTNVIVLGGTIALGLPVDRLTPC